VLDKVFPLNSSKKIMATLVESFGSVALFNNSDGSFSVQDAADGASSYKTIKDYGQSVWRSGPIVAADYYNGYRAVVFQGGHVWYVDTNWTKAAVGPNGRDTDQLSQDQISTLLLSGAARSVSPPAEQAVTSTAVETFGQYSLYQNSNGTYTVKDQSNTQWLIKDMGSQSPWTGGSIAAADLYNGYKAVVFGGGHIWYVNADWMKANVGPNGASTDNISQSDIATYFLTNSPPPTTPTNPTVPVTPVMPTIPSTNPTPARTIEDKGAVTLVQNTDGSYSAIEADGGSHQIKDYGASIWRGGPIVAADFYNGSRAVVFEGGAIWYVSMVWTKARGGPNGQDTDQITQQQIDQLFLSGGSTTPAVPRTPTTNKSPVLTNASTFLIPAISSSSIPLGFSAPTDPDGDSLSVSITSLPTQALISLNGVNISAGQTLTVSQFTSLAISKVPGTPASTTNLGTFSFSVTDGKSSATSGSVSITTAAMTQQTGSKTGDAGNNTLTGGTGNDVIDAGAGNDVIIGSSGNDNIIGGIGTDQVVYSNSSAGANFQKAADGTISLSIGSKTDMLTGVERVTFSDKAYAFDLDGSAGKAAKAIIAAFGKSAVSEYLGIAAGMTDQGATIESLAKIVVDNNLVPSDHTGFVNTVFENVVGRKPNALELINFKGMLDRGEVTTTSLLSLAANVPLVEGRMLEIAVAGVALEYQPSLF
jgi:hypothetical protein